MKSLAKNSVFNIIYTVLNMILPLITSIYASRILLAEGIGRVAYAQNIASYFIALAPLGLLTYGTREIAKTPKNQINKLFTELFIVNLISTTFFLMLYIIFVLGLDIFNSDKSLSLILAIQIFFNYINIDWFYRGKEEYIYIVLRSIFVKILSIIALFIFVKDRGDYLIYAFINVLSVSSNYIFNIIHAKKYVRFDFKDINIKKHMPSTLILASTSLLSSIYNKVDITMLGIMKGDTVVGLYSNTHKIIDIILSITTSISAVFLPRLSFYYKEDKKKFYELINSGINILVFITLPAMVGIFLLSPYIILLLYGESFKGAILTIRLFTPMIMIRSFADLICYQVSISTDNEKKRIYALSTAAIINVLLNRILIPIYAQNGAVIASIASELISDMILIVAIRKLLKIKFPIKGLVNALISSIVMIIFVEIGISLSNVLYVKCLIGVTMGATSYLLSSYLIKDPMMRLFIDRVKSIIQIKQRRENSHV